MTEKREGLVGQSRDEAVDTTSMYDDYYLSKKIKTDEYLQYLYSHVHFYKEKHVPFQQNESFVHCCCLASTSELYGHCGQTSHRCRQYNGLGHKVSLFYVSMKSSLQIFLVVPIARLV